MVAVSLVAGCASARKTRPPHSWELTRLSGTTIDWSPTPGTRAVVFLFLGAECPISNRVQPELTRLAAKFSPAVTFVPVYPNAGEDAAMIRRHRTEYCLTPLAYRDPQQHLADALDVTVTPEVVALADDGSLIYRGRVNDQFAGLGLGRPAPTRHDLQDALKAFLAGQPPTGTITVAAGCSIQRQP